MYDALPKRLAALRRQKGMSQEELANVLGVSRQAVSKWERGESSPDTLNLIGLADLYEMSLDELVRGAATQESNSPVKVAFETPEATTESNSNDASATAETTTDGVVKVEVVTTTIPLEAATSFMPKVDAEAASPTAPKTDTPAKSIPPSSPESEAQADETPARTESFSPSQCAPQAPRPQTPTSEYAHTAKDTHEYPPPTDTAYELPTTPPPPAPFSQTPFPTGAPSAPGHYQTGSQGPVAHQHKHKQHEPKGALMRFPYPIFCVILYLIMGFIFNAWHPGWIIFLTIPIYYWIAEIVEKDPIYRLRRQQREALLRSQLNLIEQGAALPDEGPESKYPPSY